MTEYTVQIDRTFPHKETWFLTAFVRKDGVQLCYVTNEGTGGSNAYQPLPDTVDYDKWRADMEEFDKFCEDWAEENSEYPGFEDTDSWIDEQIQTQLDAAVEAGEFRKLAEWGIK